MWNEKVLTKTINDNLSSGNYEAVENACRIAFEKGGLSESEKIFIKRSFIKTGDFLITEKQFIPVLINYEYAHVLSPHDLNVLKKQLLILNDFITTYFNEFTKTDLDIFLDILSIIIDYNYDFLPSKKFETVFNKIIKIKNNIENQIPIAPKKEESKHSFQLEKLLQTFAYLKFSHLTTDERIKEAGKYLSKSLRRVASKKGIIVEKTNKKVKK